MISKFDSEPITAAELAGVTFSRETASFTTTGLSAGASQNGTIELDTGFRLIEMIVNRAARIRVYSDVASRTTDLAREWGTDPEPGVGLLFDYLTEGPLNAKLSPLVDGYSTESVPTGSIPIRVTSMLGGAVTVTFNWTSTE